MKTPKLLFAAILFGPGGCHEPAPPKVQEPNKKIHIDAPGVQIDIDKKGDKKKVDVDVGPKNP